MDEDEDEDVDEDVDEDATVDATETADEASGVPQLDVGAAEAAVRAGAVLVDVREEAEWMAAHIPGSLHIAMSTIAGRVAELPRESRLVIVCRSGARSDRVAAWLRPQGFDAVNLARGIEGWSRAGLPVVTDDA